MKLPDQVKPVLEKVAAKFRLPVELWHSENGPRILDAFCELAAKLDESELDPDQLPDGYLLLALLFGWESECQFEGWNAFAWKRNEIGAIVVAFRLVGLADEASALSRAFEAWLADHDDHDAISRAYGEGTNSMSDSDRMEYLTDYFCNHAAEMFYEA